MAFDNRLLDVLLIGASACFAGYFAILVAPHVQCWRNIKKRRAAVKRRDALRKELKEHYDFK